jgi:hypothetical protein
MISTRLHGFIDYAVALVLGGLWASRSLSPPVRRALSRCLLAGWLRR